MTAWEMAWGMTLVKALVMVCWTESMMTIAMQPMMAMHLASETQLKKRTRRRTPWALAVWMVTALWNTQANETEFGLDCSLVIAREMGWGCLRAIARRQEIAKRQAKVKQQAIAKRQLQQRNCSPQTQLYPLTIHCKRKCWDHSHRWHHKTGTRASTVQRRW